MKAFFSGTDIQELHDNVDKYGNDSYYLSLIFAKDRNYVAKIVKLIDVPKNEVFFKEEGGLEHTINFNPSKAMLMFDLDVIIEQKIEWNDDIMQLRIDELKADIELKKAEALKQSTAFKGYQPTLFDGWEKNKQGLLVFKEEPNAYVRFNDANIRMNLRRILEITDEPTMEIGQLLVEATKFNADDFDEYLQMIEGCAVNLTMNMFGEESTLEALKKTRNMLKSYTGAPKWRSEAENICDIFDTLIEDAEEAFALEDMGEHLPEFTL